MILLSLVTEGWRQTAARAVIAGPRIDQRAALLTALLAAAQSPPSWQPSFELVQPDLFSAPGGQASAWADYDADGDPDYFVGFRGRPNRLYRNDSGVFRDVAADVGLADAIETRAAAWGDFDGDGDPDLYVGFATPDHRGKLYRNDGARFVDVAAEARVDLRGVSRQPAWIDYDGDGDLDLFAAFRDVPNRLLRNDGGRFVDVSQPSGLADARRTVSGVWWDFDRDGDLDLFVANQEGNANGLYRQDNGRFTDVAGELGVAGTPRPVADGGVGPAVADFDLDGDFDLFVASYGPSPLYRNENGARFADAARGSGIDLSGHGVTSAWGDLDNDGRPDLYVANFIAGQPHYRDALFHNAGAADGGWRFTPALPDLLLSHDATHGVQFVDYDGDGALDLALTNNDPQGGGHPLLRNRAAPTGRAFLVDVTDERGRRTRAGSEVRVFRAGTRELLSAGLLDTGSGYCSQNEMPVRLTVPDTWPGRVDVEVIVPGGGRRRIVAERGVDPGDHRRRPLPLRTPEPR
jgi:hypothetical protein